MLQVNIITSYIDASQVYGSNINLATTLRAKGGRLDVRPFINSGGQSVLPPDPETFCRTVNPQNESCFLAGDARSNENHGKKYTPTGLIPDAPTPGPLRQPWPDSEIKWLINILVPTHFYVIQVEKGRNISFVLPASLNALHLPWHFISYISSKLTSYITTPNLELNPRFSNPC